MGVSGLQDSEKIDKHSREKGKGLPRVSLGQGRPGFRQHSARVAFERSWAVKLKSHFTYTPVSFQRKNCWEQKKLRLHCNSIAAGMQTQESPLYALE